MQDYWELFLNFRVLGIAAPDLVVVLFFIIVGRVLGRILRNPVARYMARIAPKIDHETSVLIGRTVEWSVFFLVFCVVMKVSGIDAMHLSQTALIKVQRLTSFVMFVVAGWVLGRLLRYPIIQWLKHITPETDHAINLRIGRSIEWAVFLLVFCLVMKSGAIDVLHLPDWASGKTDYAITILISIAFTMLLFQMVEIAFYGLRKRWQTTHDHIDDTLINFLRKGIRIFIILVMALITAENINYSVHGAIAGIGIGGAAIALGAQGLIANILGTIEVVADKLYRVGDRIHFDQFDGFVTDIGLRSTKLRALTGEQILVPNRKMAEVQIRNYSKNGTVRTMVTVGVTYSTTHDQIREAMKILEEIFKKRTDVVSHQIYLKNLGAYAVDLEVIFWAKYTNSSEYNGLIGDVHMEIKRQFDAGKVEFAFPTQTLNIHQAGLS